jgi:NitT/TauT family transport system substrate-binding protein
VISIPYKIWKGQELGAPAGDAARRLFPMFARSVGIDADSVSWTSMDPPLREPLLDSR